METVYNVNEMRRALVRMREKGNRGVINKQLCEELGISDVYFNMYINNLKALFEATCEYTAKKNSPRFSPEDKREAENKIFPLWKEFLACGEKDRFDSDLRVSEDDIHNLVGFCQMFIRDRNDASRGQDKDFVSMQVWANDDFKRFRRKVETDLGIRIAQVDVMSDAQRNFLRKERKILSAWKRAEQTLADLTAQRGSVLSIKERVSDPTAIAIFDERLAEIDGKIANANKKIEEMSAAFTKLHNPETPAEAPAEAVAPVEAA